MTDSVYPSGRRKSLMHVSTTVEELSRRLSSEVIVGSDDLGPFCATGNILSGIGPVEAVSHDDVCEKIGTEIYVDFAVDADVAFHELRDRLEIAPESVMWRSSE